MINVVPLDVHLIGLAPKSAKYISWLVNLASTLIHTDYAMLMWYLSVFYPD